MDIPEVITTVLATVAGSVAIVYTTLHLQAKHRKRSLFRALLGEIQWNRSLAEHLKDDSLKSLKRYTSLHTAEYQNLRSTGELLSLPEPVRQRLRYTYEMINTHNWEIEQDKINPPGGVYFWPRNDEILENLNSLEKELLKAVKCLKQAKS